MKDYLNRAAERASGVSTGVRPALPSLFDSDGGLFASTLVERENDRRAGPPRTIADEQVAPMRERIASIKAVWTEAVQRVPAQIRDAPAEESSAGVMGVPVVAPEIATRPAKLDRNEPERAAVSSLSLAPIPRHLPKTDFLPHLAEKAGVPPPPVPAESVRGDSPPPLIGKPNRQSPTPVQTSATFVRRPRSPERRSNPKLKSNHVPFTSDDDSPSPGAIHVTIGRIEVRAIHPPAEAAPPRPPPKPALSLDEYLKRRNGGARE